MLEARYRLFRRASGVYYQQDHETEAQVSLRTKDKRAAQEKVRAANESVTQPRLNLDLARVYLKAHDAEMSNRTWAMVMVTYSGDSNFSGSEFPGYADNGSGVFEASPGTRPRSPTISR